jgi:cystathionine beta-lyase/cystathionine gamma-synthase
VPDPGIPAGRAESPGRQSGDPMVAPPVLSSALVSAGEPQPGDYGRGGNPTWAALEQALGRIEDADAVLFSSGQAASMALMLVLATGRDTIVLPDDGYYNTRTLASLLRPHGATATAVDQLDLAAVEHELRRGSSVLWAESPTNPLLRVADLAALGQLATKSASGHSDVILGAVMTRDQSLAAELRSWRTLGGGIAGPMEAWLATRGLKTLPLRIERQSASALAIAGFLAAHPRVRAAHYPGLPGPGLATAQAQMPRGFGPLLSFELDGTAAEADAVVAATRLIVPATSFGGADSTWERRGRWPGESAPESLIRLSAGLEPAADLIADISAALGGPSR